MAHTSKHIRNEWIVYVCSRCSYDVCCLSGNSIHIARMYLWICAVVDVISCCSNFHNRLNLLSRRVVFTLGFFFLCVLFMWFVLHYWALSIYIEPLPALFLIIVHVSYISRSHFWIWKQSQHMCRLLPVFTISFTCIGFDFMFEFRIFFALPFRQMAAQFSYQTQCQRNKFNVR